MIQESYIYLLLINHSLIYWKFCLKKIYFNSEFSYIEVWFTDKNSVLLEMEDKIIINLVID